MIKINLVPPEYIEKLNNRAIIAKAVVAGVITVAVVVLVSGWHVARAATIELKKTRLETELKGLQADVDRVKAIEAQIAEVQRYLDSINGITKGRMIYTKFMQDATVNLPGTIWFSSIGTGLSGSTLSLSYAVNSNSAYDLAYWINALETDAKYSDVVVSGISVSEADSVKTLRTSVTVKYAYK